MILYLTSLYGVCHVTMLLALICHSRRTDAAFILRPSDTAVKVGSNATLYCKISSSYSYVSWWWILNGQSQTLADRCSVISGLRSRFTVDASEPGVCNLIVRHASLADANYYTCEDKYAFPSLAAMAQLVALRSQPTAAAFVVPPIDTSVEVGSNATLNCKVSTTSQQIWWTWTGNISKPTIASRCSVSAEYQSRFAVETNEPSECNLIVISASLEDAANYTCIHVESFMNTLSSWSAARLDVRLAGVASTRKGSDIILSSIVPTPTTIPTAKGTFSNRNGSGDIATSAFPKVTSAFSLYNSTSSRHTTKNKETSESQKIIIALGVLLGVSVITIIILVVLLVCKERCATKKPQNDHEMTEDETEGRRQQATDSAYTSLDQYADDQDRRVYAQLTTK